MVNNRNIFTLLALLVVLAVIWPMAAYVHYASRAGSASPAPPAAHLILPDPEDPAEVAIGERLFREPRFAQFFAAHATGVVNVPMAELPP